MKQGRTCQQARQACQRQSSTAEVWHNLRMNGATRDVPFSRWDHSQMSDRSFERAATTTTSRIDQIGQDRRRREPATHTWNRQRTGQRIDRHHGSFDTRLPLHLTYGNAGIAGPAPGLPGRVNGGSQPPSTWSVSSLWSCVQRPRQRMPFNGGTTPGDHQVAFPAHRLGVHVWVLIILLGVFVIYGLPSRRSCNTRLQRISPFS